MRRITCAFLLLLLSPLAALAQGGRGEGPDLGLPRRKPEDKDKVRFVDPDDEKAPAKKPADGERKETPAEKPGLDEGAEAIREALHQWPADAATSALAALVEEGEASRPVLLAILAGKDRNARCAAAVGLSRIGNTEDATAILKAMRDRKLSSRVHVLLEAAASLDLDATRQAALALLAKAPRPAQERAARFLESRLRDEDRPAVEACLTSRSTGARLLGLGMLAKRYGIEAARGHAVTALGDRSPDVALSAAGMLAADKAALDLLVEKARSYDSRPAAYAALSLLFRAQAEGSQPFDAVSLQALLGGRGLRAVDPLARGVAAIVLGYVGFEERNAEIDAALESEIIPVLLDNVGGSNFFPDQPSLSIPSAGLLERLTGRTFGLDVRAWRLWWAESKEGFVVRRRLREVRPDDYGSLVLAIDLPGRPALLLSTDPGGLAAGALIVEPDVARFLVEILVREGFFGDRWTAAGGADSLKATIEVGRRERTAALAADQAATAMADLAERLEAIRARSVWQRYWDRDDYPDPESFIRARSGWFGPDAAPAERDAHLKIVIAEALDDIPADERLPAVELLGKLRGAPLDDRLAFALLLMAEAEGTVTPFAEAAIRFLADERATVIRTRLCDFLGGLAGPRAATLLAEALAALGRDAVLSSLADERPSVRRASVAALGRLGGDDAVDRLRGFLDDADLGVRLEALASLGTLKAREAVGPILRAAEDESAPRLRAAALRALGAVAGKEAIPTLLRALGSDQMPVRIAAIQGLEATGHEDALKPLLYAMRKDTSEGIIAIAARAVVALGGEQAVTGLRRLAGETAAERGVRVVATQALAKLMDREALAALVEDEIVGEEAALALAGLRDGRAVPRLLASLAAGRTRRVLPALEGISARSFGVRSAAEVATLFLGWWEVHKDGSPATWLVSALKDRGYEVAALEVEEGGAAREALGVLVRALDDASWAVRHAASRELTSRTGKDFGRIQKYTSREDAQRVADLWRRWHESSR